MHAKLYSRARELVHTSKYCCVAPSVVACETPSRANCEALVEILKMIDDDIRNFGAGDTSKSPASDQDDESNDEFVTKHKKDDKSNDEFVTKQKKKKKKSKPSPVPATSTKLPDPKPDISSGGGSSGQDSSVSKPADAKPDGRSGRCGSGQDSNNSKLTKTAYEDHVINLKSNLPDFNIYFELMNVGNWGDQYCIKVKTDGKLVYIPYVKKDNAATLSHETRVSVSAVFSAHSPLWNLKENPSFQSFLLSERSPPQTSASSKAKTRLLKWEEDSISSAGSNAAEDEDDQTLTLINTLVDKGCALHFEKGNTSLHLPGHFWTRACGSSSSDKHIPVTGVEDLLQIASAFMHM